MKLNELQFLSPYLERQRFKAISSFVKGDILDLGCGLAGAVSLLEPGQHYVGIEKHPEVFRWLVENFPEHEFFNLDLDKDRITLHRRFDTILFTAVIEHLTYPENILEIIPDLLANDGKLIITTPTPLGNLIHHYGTKIHLFSKFAASEHTKTYTSSDIEELVASASMKVDLQSRFLFHSNQLFICSVVIDR